MELFTLILVNLATTVALYIIFSIKHTQTVNKMKAEGMPRDLQANFRTAIEFINSSVDLMDHKLDTFYRLVRKSEEMIRELEDRPQGKVRKKKSVPVEAGNERAAVKGNYEKGAAEKKSKSSDFEEFIRAGTADDKGFSIDKILSEMGEDRAEISGTDETLEQAYRRGETSKPVNAAKMNDEFNPALLPGSGILEKIGAGVKRFFGIRETPLWPPVYKETTAKPVDIPANMPSFEKFIDAAQKAGRPGSPDRIPAPKSSRDRLEISEEARSIAGSRIPQIDEEPDMPLFSYGTASAQDSAEDELDKAAIDRRMDFLAEKEETTDAEISNTEVKGSKKAFAVRLLLKNGYRKEEIAKLTGIAPAEVELASMLPDIPQRPRKHRIK